jgi:hypothetical protein
MPSSKKIHSVRTAIVLLGLTAAFAVANAYGALAKTKIDIASAGAPSTSAAAPAADPPIPVAESTVGPTRPSPACDTSATPPTTGDATAEAPKPTATAPTAVLSSIANATVIRSRSVSTIVTVPAGLPVTNPTEISILFGLSGSSRLTQTYDPAAGNRFVFNFDARDGSARTENVAVSLADRAGEGAHFGFVNKVPVEALYDATLSPLTFTLVNDCDFELAGLVPQNSEPVIHWGDDRGQEATGNSGCGPSTPSRSTSSPAP